MFICKNDLQRDSEDVRAYSHSVTAEDIYLLLPEGYAELKLKEVPILYV